MIRGDRRPRHMLESNPRPSIYINLVVLEGSVCELGQAVDGFGQTVDQLRQALSEFKKVVDPVGRPMGQDGTMVYR